MGEGEAGSEDIADERSPLNRLGSVPTTKNEFSNPNSGKA